MSHHLKTILLLFLPLLACPVLANIPGGGDGTGANVTLTDNGNGTVTMANGIVSVVISKTSAVINHINYTFNNTGSPQTLDLLAGGTDGGKLYWENSNNEGLSFSYSVVSDPASDGGNYAEVSLVSTTVAGIEMDVHYSMLRGSTGFYVTAIWAHSSTDPAFSFGECRDNIYAGSIFNWMSVDGTRNRLMEVSGGSAVPAHDAPKECTLWTNGIYAGQYEDKYKYSADLGVNHVWGWSSVGTGGYNVGLWNITASSEYYNGGPLKRELMEHIGTTVLNMLNGGHYGQGGDGSFASGEVWTKVDGPYFIYCNNISSSVTGTNQAAQELYSDALAQGAAEQSAWPYAWFTNANYATASQRGTVSGQIVIADPGNPNASASNLWVGLVRQPATSTGSYDFQAWMKPYQFWVKTDTNGNFTIPNVIATNDYTLYAFGPGAPEIFMSQSQTGGNPPLLYDLPASPFAVTVTAGATNDLHTVTWTPARVGATVFQIGYPDRMSNKFRHGNDYWVGDIGPSPDAPSPIWSKWQEYQFDFPGGPDYTVGQSRWTTDWNFCQPVVADSQGNYYPSASTITFNLATAPTNGATASLYLGLSSDYYAAIIVTVNGHNLGSVSGLTGSPNNSIPTTGYYAGYADSDTTVREGDQAMASDERLTFPASLLQQGQNTINLSFRETGASVPPGYFADHFMYDYIRLELTGYVPPAPASVAAYAGNNCDLVCWPVTPGATSYNILRSTTSGSGYAPLASGVTGPVCGSGWNNATYLDTNANNGTTYYYVVQSVNPGGSSADSPQSSGVAPNAGLSTSAPAAPAGVSIGSATHHSVALSWSASSGADYYTVYRSTLFNNGGGATNVLGTIVLANNLTGTSYTDTSPSDGSKYSYFVTATSAGGTSGDSHSAMAVPLPTPPASAPGSPTQSGAGANSVTLSWSSVSGAIGYDIYRASSAGGPFTFLTSVIETTYTDGSLNSGTTYYYEVVAMNDGGVSPAATVSAVTLPAAPASLSATAGDSQVLLSWPAVAGASGYVLERGTTSSNETTTVVSGYAGTSYTDTGLNDGTTYYYIVAASDAAGTGADSPEASATPTSVVISGGRNLVWQGDGSANAWDVNGTANWLSNTTATVFVNGDNVTFNDVGSNNVPVSINAVVQPSLVTVNASKDYTFSGAGSIAGTNALIKSGAGALTIDTTNSYSGETVLNAGTLTLNTATAAATNTITLNGGTLALGADIGNTLDVAGTAALLPGNVDYNNSRLIGGGLLNVTITGNNTFSPQADMSGFYGTNELGASSGWYRFFGSLGSAAASFDLGTGTVSMINRNGNVTIELGSLAGGDRTSLSGASSVNAPTAYVVGGNSHSTAFAGSISDGAGTTAIVKAGGGVWTLTGTNTYSGGTTVNGGTLSVDNSVGSGAGSGTVTVNTGGMLAGSGAISGAVTVNSGGGFAPGNPLGTLTLGNNLTLAAGSTTFMQIEHSPLASNAANIAGTLYEGGTLMVTNIGTASLTNGDSFQLFSAGGCSGTFDSYVLPPLTGNLVWNTNLLVKTGTLTVVALTPPAIAAGRIQNGNLVLSGAGAPADWTYYELSSTNTSLPLAQWTPVATNQTDLNGNFAVTNAVDASQPQRFLILRFQ